MQQPTTFEIKSGIPLTHSNNATTRYPFADMLVGDCFDVPAPDNANAVEADKVGRQLNSAWRYYTRHDSSKKFAIRIIRDGASCVARCWRTA